MKEGNVKRVVWEGNFEQEEPDLSWRIQGTNSKNRDKRQDRDYQFWKDRSALT